MKEEEDGGRGREDWEGAECCSSQPCDTLRERGGRKREREREGERERGWEIYCI